MTISCPAYVHAWPLLQLVAAQGPSCLYAGVSTNLPRWTNLTRKRHGRR
jgi:hypothetical protein